jgi:hypothetical protein
MSTSVSPLHATQYFLMRVGACLPLSDFSDNLALGNGKVSIGRRRYSMVMGWNGAGIFTTLAAAGQAEAIRARYLTDVYNDSRQPGAARSFQC